MRGDYRAEWRPATSAAPCAPRQLQYDSAVENPSVARVLNEIADLLELKGENIFRVRAYRTGAQVVTDSPVRVADLDVPSLLAIDGIGKDLAARIRDIAATGTTSLRDELLQMFPASILDVMRLQGIGPKTVALLYHTLNIALARRPRGGRQGRRHPRHQGHGRQEGDADPDGHRRAAPARRPPPDRPRLRDRRDARRLAARGGARRHLRHRRQPAPRRRDQRRHRHPGHGRAGRCARALHPLRTGRARARPRRHQGQRSADQPDAGRPAPRRARIARRRAAVLHRLEGAQHRAAAAGAVARATR